MVNTLQETIRKTLSRSKEEGSKKQISLVIDERLLQMSDVIIEQFKSLTNGKLVTSRNQLFEKAIDEYVQAASDVLLQDHYINIEEMVEQIEKEDESTILSEKWDLVIFPAQNKGFEEVFLGKNQWYSVRIASWRIPKIKYVACYRGAPYSGITHYAKVKEIKPHSDPGKYVIFFDSEPIKLNHTVKLGNSDVMTVRKSRYTSLEKLENANEVYDLW